MNREIRKVFVLAGGDDQISLINELRNRFSGVEIVLIDMALNTLATVHADRHLRISTLDQEEVLRASMEENIDMIITACGDQTLPTMAYVSEKMGLNCYLTYNQAINLTNKLYMKKLMVENGIPTSKYKLVSTSDSELDLSYPLVVKPVDNNGSKGIAKIYDKADLKDAIQVALNYTRTKNVIIEEFKEGNEYSIEAFIKDGQANLIIVTKLVKIKDNTDRFTILKCTYPCELSDTVLNKIKHIITDIGKAFEIDNVPLMIQLIVNQEEISVVEFSARTGGGSKHHFVRTLSGVNIFQNLLDITLGVQPALNIIHSPKFASLNYIYAKPGLFKGLQNLDFLKHQKVVFDYYFYKLIGTKIERSDVSSDRPAGFFVLAETEAELIEKTAIIDQNIKVLNDQGEDIMIHGLFNKVF